MKQVATPPPKLKLLPSSGYIGVVIPTNLPLGDDDIALPYRLSVH